MGRGARPWGEGVHVCGWEGSQPSDTGHAVAGADGHLIALFSLEHCRPGASWESERVLFREVAVMQQPTVPPVPHKDI